MVRLRHAGGYETLVSAPVVVRPRHPRRARASIRATSSAASDRPARPPGRTSTTASSRTARYVNPLTELRKMPKGVELAPDALAGFTERRELLAADLAALPGRAAGAERRPARQARPTSSVDVRAVPVPRAPARSGRRRPCRLGALRRRQHRRSARARRGQSAQLPARHALGNRSAAGTNPVRRRGLRDRPSRTSRRSSATRRWCMDDEPSLYLYRLTMGGHEQTGLCGCFSLDEYDTGSSRSTRRRARTRKTTARGTSSSCARRPASCS